MLLSFSIENFRSFREETTLSMLADRRVTDHPEQAANVQVLRGLPKAFSFNFRPAPMPVRNDSLYHTSVIGRRGAALLQFEVNATSLAHTPQE
jgi:AAA15 family ATPase/GTPase